MLLFTVFTVLPVLISVVLSFSYFNVLESPEFIGLGNYTKMFVNDNLTVKAFSNTVIIAMIVGPGGYLLSIALAWIISEFPRGLRSVLTLLLYAPSISGSAYMIWQIIYSGDQYGWLNGILMSLNLIYEPIQWLTDTSYMMVAAIIAILWTSLGTGFLSFIAGFQSMDRKLFEAAAVDGIKNRFQELWYITLPSIRPQLMFGAVMSITASFGVGDIINGLFGFPSTNYALYTVVHMLQDYGSTRFEMGYASAIATVLFLLMIIINKVVQKVLSKVGE
ncbi:MAG: sugar ABC transporter permease [Clostridia bacterium]|nr:sugar ABC transporter permease [Clostridia bacterium]